MADFTSHAAARSADESARRGIFGSLFLSLYYVGYAFYLRSAYREVGAGGLGFGVVILLLGVAVSLWIARTNRNAGDTLLRLSTSSSPYPEELKLALHRTRLRDELIRVASLVDRAGVEAIYNSDKAEQTQPGPSRQRSLLALKSTGLWEHLTVVEQNLLVSPEGSWPAEAISSTLPRAEDVCVLRWVLGIDEVLVPFAFVQTDLKSSFSLTANPALADGEGCMQPWDLRPEQGTAHSTLLLCLAEGVSRGMFTTGSDDLDEYVRLAQSVGNDLLLGSKHIHDATEGEIRRIGQIAFRRHKALTAIIDFLYSDGTSTFQIDSPTNQWSLI